MKRFKTYFREQNELNEDPYHQAKAMQGWFDNHRGTEGSRHQVTVSLHPDGDGYIYGNQGHNPITFKSTHPSGTQGEIVADHEHGHVHIRDITVHQTKNSS